MSSPERSSFSQDRLRWLEFEMGQELEMIEEGSTPESIAQSRNFLAKVHENNRRFDEQAGNAILARYGAEDNDQLPAAGLIEYAEAHAAWIKEHPIDE